MTSPRTEWFRPMTARDPQEEHRTSSPLELLFDLTFVVAIASAAAELHHAISEDHVLPGVLGYLAVFFAIWWAWMNFTWFASAYDCDDALYRVLTVLMMAGRPRPRRRGARGVRALRHRHRRAGLHDHAGRDDRAVAARRARRPGPCPDRPDLRRRARRHPAALDRAGVRPGAVGVPRLRRPGGAASWPCRCSPRRAPATRRAPRPAPRRGTPSTSPSATGCSR